MNEILDQIRQGLDLQIKDAIERDDVPQAYVQQVTQSYLLLQIVDRLDVLVYRTEVICHTLWSEQKNGQRKRT